MQPYITKTLQAMSEPPVQLAKITIGDGSIGSGATFIELSTVGLGIKPSKSSKQV